MKEMADNSVDSIVTDPPYELGFMGKSWDASGIAFNIEVWQEALRVLKPGGHLIAFSGSRTYHRMAVAIEDAGFEIRDQIQWIYGSGFPKSLDVSKAIHKAAGAERERVPYKGGIASGQANYGGGGEIHNGTKVGEKAITPAAQQWNGWGTALKPAHEPMVLARKPIVGTVANNVLTYGVGGLNIDGARVATTDSFGGGAKGTSGFAAGYEGDGWVAGSDQGRWPANVIHDGSDEVVALFPQSKTNRIESEPTTQAAEGWGTYGSNRGARGYSDEGSAARFFYCAKASKKDRNEGLDGFEVKKNSKMFRTANNTSETISEGFERFDTQPQANNHPTVKPTDLMRYLCRLITPPAGIVLDPFMGSGSTGKAAILEGFDFIGIEQSAEYVEIAKARIAFAQGDSE